MNYTGPANKIGLKSEFVYNMQEIFGRVEFGIRKHTLPEFFYSIFNVDTFILYPEDTDIEKLTLEFPGIN